MSVKATTVLHLENISKSFGDLVALDNVSIKLYKGEILAILGENGAGKSTLMKILSGLYQPDEGEIFVNRPWFEDTTSSIEELTEVTFSNPRFAMQLGIGMVYQHFKLVETLTVMENITLGNEITFGKSPVIDKKTANKKIEELGVNYGLHIPADKLIQDLPVGLKQRVEILKQLYRDAQLLILDEPTAVLTPSEVKEFFKTMKNLKDLGKSLIFISHKLKEPLEIADRIVVIRKGKIISEVAPENVDQKTLAEMVIGKKIIESAVREDTSADGPILKLSNINLIDENNLKSLNDLDFQVFPGEILGVAGVQGNGQTELVDVIMGLRKATDGVIEYTDSETKTKFRKLSTLDRIKLGIAYIPEDRNVQGLISDFPITENVWLGFYSNDQDDNLELRKEIGGLEINESEEANEEQNIKTRIQQLYNVIQIPKDILVGLSKKVISNFDVAAESENTLISNLSGGNQQKVLVGRELSKNPKLIIASQPTRGVDVGVMEKIHKYLIEMRNDGAGIFLISSDLDEVLKLSDRIIVMFEGKIVATGTLDELSVSQIGQYMTRGLLGDDEGNNSKSKEETSAK